MSFLRAVLYQQIHTKKSLEFKEYQYVGYEKRQVMGWD